jgi:hypothetical protein
MLPHRERLTVRDGDIIWESTDDRKQKWRASRPPFFAAIPEQFVAVAVLQPGQFGALAGDFCDKPSAPDRN